MQSVTPYSKKGPLAKQMNFRIINADNTVPAQIASIRAALPSKPDAIIIDANSPTALNRVLQSAQKQGAKILTIDSSVTLPTAYKLSIKGGLEKAAYTTALWLARSMHGKGNVVINNGVLGTDGEAQQNHGVKRALKRFPNIKIISEISGEWSTAKSAEKFAQVLATHPKIDGVWNSGGEIGVNPGSDQGEAAADSRWLGLPSTGTSSSARSTESQGLQCGAASYPTTLGAQAMRIAVELMQGKKYPYSIQVPYTTYTNNAVKTDTPTVAMAWNVNAFKDLPSEFSIPFSPPDAKLDAHEIAAGMK